MSDIVEPIENDWTRRLLGLALVLAIFSAFAFQGSRGLYESTEGRYAECARETMLSGNLLEPMLLGEHHWTKPPLTYALIGAGLACFGNNPWGARMYLAIAFVLTVGAVYLAGRAMWDRKTGALAALIYATCPYMVAAAFAISCDTLVTFFMAGASACFWLAVRGNRKRYIFAMWVFLGLATLTKGPVVAICLFGIFPAYFFLWRRKAVMPRFFTVTGMAAFVVIGGGWYLYEIYLHPDLWNYWIMHETVGRFTENEFQRNPEIYKIVTMYLPIAIFGAAPWAFMVFFARKQLGVSKETFRHWRDWDELPQWAFVLAGTIVPLVLLAISTSRMPLYLLPLFTPFVLGLARGMALLIEQGRFRLKTVTMVALCCTVLFVSGKAFSATKETRSDMGRLAAIVKPLLEKHPGSELAIACREELNGLNFYLERDTILRFNFPAKPDDTPESIGANTTLPEGTLILGRAKHLKLVDGRLPESLYEIAYTDRNWTVLLTKEPFNLGELLQNATATMSKGK